MMKKISFILFSFCLLTFSLQAQENAEQVARHKFGFVTGYANQSFLGVSYTYNVMFFQLQHYFSLSDKEKWDIELITQPQFNTVRYKEIDFESEISSGFEFGVNIGFLFRRKIATDNVHIYTFISTGPHYVSGTPDRQVPGFIFSDNLFLGFDVKLTDKLSFDIRSGIRHISNASIKQPNRGVNSSVVNAGVLLKL